MAELVDAADSKSVFERSGSSSLPRGTNTEKKVLRKQGLFFRLVESGGLFLSFFQNNQGNQLFTLAAPGPTRHRLA